MLAALALAACTDDRLDVDKPTSDGERKITFVFPGIAKGSTTYSTVGSAEENKLETLDIYVFTEHPNSAANPKPMVLEEILQSSNTTGDGRFEITSSGNDKMVTVTVPTGVKKHFFFIANGRDISQANAAKLFETTADEFLKVAHGTVQNHITCPLEMTADLLVDNIDQTGTTTVDVTLTRRVARFDVKNDSDDSGFILDEILIYNARHGVNTFARYDTDIPYAKRHPNAIVNQMPAINFSVVPNANHGLSNSVFYLNPTIIEDMKNPAKALNFQLVGRSTTTGAPQIYPVQLQMPNGDPIVIDANHLYTIHILNMGIGYINATLSVLEWTHDPDNNIDNPAGEGTIKLKDKDGKAFTNSVLDITNDDLSEQTVLVDADTEWEIYVDPMYSWVEHNGASLATDKVNKEFTIKAKSVNPSPRVRIAHISVFNKHRPSINQMLLFRQAASTDSYFTLGSQYIIGSHQADPRVTIPGEMTKQFAIDVTVPDDLTWKATVDAGGTWLETAYSTGTGDPTGPAKLLVTPKQMNPSDTDTRTTYITFESVPADPADKITLVVPVTQTVANLGDIRLSAAGLSNGEFNLSSAGFPGSADGKRQIQVYAHTDWDVEVNDAVTNDWVKIAPADISKGTPTGDYNGSFKVFVEPNTGTARNATITVKNKTKASITATIEVKQAAPVTP